MRYPEVNLSAADEWTHPAPSGSDVEAWCDTWWFDVNAADVGILGTQHLHVSNTGVSRFQVHYIVDGVRHSYVNKFTCSDGGVRKVLTDGHLSFEVLTPFAAVRLMFDGPRFGFDLEVRSRFPFGPFVRPLMGVAHERRMSGHYEIPVHCRGTFEIRDGPARGEQRPIDCFSFRDHSWSDRFSVGVPWLGLPGPERYVHLWPCIYLNQSHIQTWGVIGGATGQDEVPSGGFLTSSIGQHPVELVEGSIIPSSDDWRRPSQFKVTIRDPDKGVFHINTTKLLDRVPLYALSLTNDVEKRIDAWDVFAEVEVEVEETGERGRATIEYGVTPPATRYLT